MWTVSIIQLSWKKNSVGTHKTEYEMIGAENQQETVGLLVELLFHLVVHAVWVVRWQFVHNKLLRKLNLNKHAVLAVTGINTQGHLTRLYEYSLRHQADQSHKSK